MNRPLMCCGAIYTGKSYSNLMFIPLIKEQQTGHGSRAGYERYERYAGPSDQLSPMRNVGSSSNVIPSTWHPQPRTDGPYIQHRGGLRGFLYVFDDTTFGFVDLRGNTQFISIANFLNDDRASTTCAGDASFILNCFQWKFEQLTLAVQ